VWLFIVASSVLFFLSAASLNRLALVLSPPALAVVLLYSYTKRFTSLSHLFLGLSLAIAPVGGWVAVRGSLTWDPFILAGAVLFWVAGFDIIYACQDVQFDRGAGLFSLPSRLGVPRALQLAALFHVLMVALLAITFQILSLSVLSWVGLVVVAASLVYEHSLVSPTDLSRVNVAFFALNGVVSVVLLVFVSLDLCLLV
jgi:4-hydroxybenzoate polyprenyltransferase